MTQEPSSAIQMMHYGSYVPGGAVSQVVGLIETEDSFRVRVLESHDSMPERVEYRFPTSTSWRVETPPDAEDGVALDAAHSTFGIDSTHVLVVDAPSAGFIRLDDLVVVTPTEALLAAAESPRLATRHALALTAAGAMHQVADTQFAMSDDIASMLDDAANAWPLVDIAVRMHDRTTHITLSGGATTSIEIADNGLGATRIARFHSSDFLLRLLDVTGLSAAPLRVEMEPTSNSRDESSTNPAIVSSTTCTIIALTADGSIVGGVSSWVENSDGSIAEVELDEQLTPTGRLAPTDVDQLSTELISFLPDGFI